MLDHHKNDHARHHGGRERRMRLNVLQDNDPRLARFLPSGASRGARAGGCELSCCLFWLLSTAHHAHLAMSREQTASRRFPPLTALHSEKEGWMLTHVEEADHRLEDLDENQVCAGCGGYNSLRVLTVFRDPRAMAQLPQPWNPAHAGRQAESGRADAAGMRWQAGPVWDLERARGREL